METDECPTSLLAIDRQSMTWVRDYDRAQKTGVALYGPDLSKWPAKAVDAFSILNAQRKRADAVLMVRSAPRED